MKTALQLEPRYDVERLRAELRRLEERTWAPVYVPEFFEGAWSALPLYAKVGADGSDLLKGGEGAYASTPILRELPYLASVIDSLPGQKLRVRLMRLEPGSTIKPHRDRGGGWSSGHIRLHLPVQSSEDVHFVVAGKRIEMREGELWYANVMRPHSVRNAGASARIHVVIDLVLDDELAALFPPESGLDRLLRWAHRHGLHDRVDRWRQSPIAALGRRLLGLREVPTHRAAG